VRRLEAPAGRTLVVEAPLLQLPARLVEPGWRFVPRGLARVVSYPSGSSRLRVDLTGADAAHSREGSRLDVLATLTYSIPTGRLLDLHRAHGEDYESAWLVPLVREAVGARLAAASFDALRDRDPDLLQSVREAVAGKTEPEGLSVAGLRLEQAAETGVGGAIVRVPAKPVAARVVLVGLDSFTWRIADPLMKSGRMPNLAALAARGVRANLRTITPILSPVVWTSIATGMKPSRHGIVDFVVTARDSGALVPVTSAMRRVPALWNILGRQEVPTDVVAWWASWPAESGPGRIVSDRVAFQLFDQTTPDWKNDAQGSRGKTWPPDLFESLRPLITAPADIPDTDLAPFLGGPLPPDLAEEDQDRVRQFRTVVAASRTYHAIALSLLAKPLAAAGPSLSLFYYEGPDTASHLFMRDRPPRLPGVSERDLRLFGPVVDRYYEAQDRQLGEIVAAAGPDTDFLVVSDHGFKSAEDRPVDSDPRIDRGRAAEWHAPVGVLVLAGPDIRRGGDLGAASVLDIAPTILSLFGLPAARDMDGQPLGEAFTPEFAQAHPIAWIDSYGGVRPSDDEALVASDGDREVIERLRSIGYIGDERLTAQNNRGLIALDEGDVDGAIHQFEQAIDRGAATPEVRVNLARALLQKGDLTQARAVATDLLRRNPEEKQAEVLLAAVAIKEGRLDEAEAGLRKALRLDPNMQLAHTKLGEVLQRQGRDDEALAEFERSVAIAPLSPVEHNHIGNLHRKHGRIDAAMAAYGDALRADPQYVGAYNNLGLCLQEKGRFDEAGALYAKALAIRPENPILRNSLATLLAARGRKEEALAEVDRALASQPDWPVALGNKATLLFEMGRMPEARKAYERWVAVEPDNVESRLGYALVLLQAQDAGAASAQFEAVLKRDPKNLRAHVALGEGCLRRGDLGCAASHLEAAVASEGKVPRAWNSLGEVYLRQGHPDRAAAAFKRSLAIDPSQPEVRARLAAAR
jgi:tetratricopeptide (TPR) repeat protein